MRVQLTLCEGGILRMRTLGKVPCKVVRGDRDCSRPVETVECGGETVLRDGDALHLTRAIHFRVHILAPACSPSPSTTTPSEMPSPFSALLSDAASAFPPVCSPQCEGDIPHTRKRQCLVGDSSWRASSSPEECDLVSSPPEKRRALVPADSGAGNSSGAACSTCTSAHASVQVTVSSSSLADPHQLRPLLLVLFPISQDRQMGFPADVFAEVCCCCSSRDLTHIPCVAVVIWGLLPPSPPCWKMETSPQPFAAGHLPTLGRSCQAGGVFRISSTL